MKNVKAKLVKPTMVDAYDIGASPCGMVVRYVGNEGVNIYIGGVKLCPYLGFSNYVKTEHDIGKRVEFFGLL